MAFAEMVREALAELWMWLSPKFKVRTLFSLSIERMSDSTWFTPSATRIASLAESRLYTWNCFSFRSAVRRYENRFSPTTRTKSVFHRVRVLSSHRVRVTSVCRTVLGSHRALPSMTRVESLPESRLYTWNCFGFRGYLFFERYMVRRLICLNAVL